MLTLFLTILLSVSPWQAVNQVSAAQKKDFIQLIKTLPHKGEFYTDAAVKKARPYLPVLLSLTEKDIGMYDIYPFLALSRGLCDRKAQRDYAVRHFAKISHPTLKLGWGVMLFDSGATSPEIVHFLRAALEAEDQSKSLAEMLGPEYESFRRRVKSWPAHNKRWQRPGINSSLIDNPPLAQLTPGR